MSTNYQLIQFVRHQIADGYTKEETFNLWNRQFNGSPINLRFFDTLFDHVQNGRYENVPPSYLQPMIIMLAEYKKYQWAIDQRICPKQIGFDCEMKILTQRYALDMRHRENGAFDIVLFNNLQGQKKIIEVDVQFQLNRGARLAPLSLDRFLLFNLITPPGRLIPSQTNIYLFNLNVQQLTCTIIDSTTMEGVFRRAVVDCDDPKRFLTFSEESFFFCFSQSCRDVDDSITQLFRGSIYNDQIQLEALPRVHPDMTKTTLKYQSNKVYGLELATRNHRQRIAIAHELTLFPDTIETRPLCSIEMDIANHSHCNLVGHGAWIGKIFFLLKNTREGIYCVKFDLEEEKMTRVGNAYMNPVQDMVIQNGTMIVSMLRMSSCVHLTRAITDLV